MLKEFDLSNLDKDHVERAWQLYCKDTKDCLDKRDTWESLSVTMKNYYLNKAIIGNGIRLKNCSSVSGKKEGVFCIFYSKNSKPHLNNHEVLENDIIIPEVLMIMSYRSSIGFPGGTVEKDEIAEFGIKKARIKALKREIREEIGYDISKKRLSEIICTHELDDFVVHLYGYELSENEMLDLQKDYAFKKTKKTEKHIRSEISGLNMVQCANYGKYKNYGLSLLLQNNLIFAVREELVIALNDLKIVDEELLVEACSIAGFKLDELIK